jgi:hypothetical protein
VPEGDQDHRRVALAPAVALGGLDQLVDLTLGEMFAWPELSIGATNGCNCPFLCCWRYQSETCFSHVRCEFESILPLGHGCVGQLSSQFGVAPELIRQPWPTARPRIRRAFVRRARWGAGPKVGWRVKR